MAVEQKEDCHSDCRFISW